MVVANALPVLARLLLASPQHFVALCSSYAAAAGNVAPDPSRNMPADLGALRRGTHARRACNQPPPHPAPPGQSAPFPLPPGHLTNPSMHAHAPHVLPTPIRPPGGAEVVLWRLLDLWTDSFDAIGQAGARRLCGLALCSALALPSRAVLGLLDGLLIAITAVW